MKIILGLFFSFTLFMPFNLLALEKGKWIFIKDNDWCYIGALNIETDLPKDKNRGENYIIVYMMFHALRKPHSFPALGTVTSSWCHGG